EPDFVGGWVPDPTPEVAAPACTTTSPLGDRLPMWLGGAVAPSAAATGWLALVCAGCIAVTAYTLLHHRGVATSAAAVPLPLSTAAVMPMPTPTPESIVVDVGGRVRRPGLVTLPLGARVADALQAAGGALRPRDVLALNLAARVTDGELLMVGMPGPVAAGGDASAASGPVNLNTATAEQLDALPGIGPVLAQHIIDFRTAHGGFRDVGQLREVSG